MDSHIQASTRRISQPEPVTTQSDGEDPWQKSCVLTLDGGGIRGYASLWMLKILMEAIEVIERGHTEPHESSFWPNVEDSLATDSPAGNQHNEGLELPSRAQTDSTLGSRLTGRPFRRTTNETGLAESQPTDDRAIDSCSRYEGYLPCHYFDYIAGTSTGGLNAIMLGRLRMRVEDCLQRYPEMAQNVFSGKKRSVLTRVMTLTSTKYNSVQLEDEIKKIIECRAPPNATPRQGEFAFNDYHSPYDLCKTVVVANEHDGVADKPYLFRTYPHYSTAPDVKNPGPADKNEIWRVARATSAAPTYFDPIQIGGKEYSDGGVGSNNPAQLMLREVTAKAGTNLLIDAMGVLVSIGAGQKPTTRLRVKHRFPGFSSLKPVKEISKIIKRLKDTSTDVERTHEHVKEIMEQIGFENYYRWSGGEEVGGLGLDEWHPNPKGKKPTTATLIEQHVRSYMGSDGVRPQVIKCAQELIKRRRDRIAYLPDHGIWRRYTHCTLLRCPYCGDLLETRDAVKRHVISIHPEDLSEDINLDSLVKRIKEKRPWCRGGPL